MRKLLSSIWRNVELLTWKGKEIWRHFGFSVWRRDTKVQLQRLSQLPQIWRKRKWQQKTTCPHVNKSYCCHRHHHYWLPCPSLKKWTICVLHVQRPVNEVLDASGGRKKMFYSRHKNVRILLNSGESTMISFMGGNELTNCKISSYISCNFLYNLDNNSVFSCYSYLKIFSVY